MDFFTPIFDIKILDKKGVDNLAVDHFSMLENPEVVFMMETHIND